MASTLTAVTTPTMGGAEAILAEIASLQKQQLIVVEAIGAASGALGGKAADFGIDDDFIKSVASRIDPGTSALFLLTRDAVLDKVADALRGYDFEIIHTSLPEEQEAELRAAFE